MGRIKTRHVAYVVAAFVSAVVPACGQAVDQSVDVKVLRPKRMDATAERRATLQVADGFTLAVFAEGLGNARMLALAPDGSILLTRREEGDVVRLVDADGDGKAERQDTVLKMKSVHGICVHENTLFLADVKNVYAATIAPDGSIGTPKVIGEDLPDGGQHPNRTLGVGPDKMLYITVGSTCNVCRESNPELATILRCDLDGTDRVVFATGLRNTVGFGWHPGTGELWGMDHGIDDMGDDKPGEELNLLEQGNDYGWPFVSNSEVNTMMELPKGMTPEVVLSRNTNPVLLFTAHAAPIGMVFAPLSSVGEKESDAFVAFRGSWNRKPASGYSVMRIDFEDGKPVEFLPVVTGFLMADGISHFGRPAGMVLAKDGSLLFTDDTNGVVYRLTGSGGAIGK